MSREKFRSLAIADRKQTVIGDGAARPINSPPNSSLQILHFLVPSEIQSFVRSLHCAKSGRNHVMRFIMFREISLSAVSLRHSYLLPSFIYRCIGGTGASSFGILFSRLSRKRGRNRSPKRTSAGTSERSTFDRIKYGRGWRIHATIVN